MSTNGGDHPGSVRIVSVNVFDRAQNVRVCDLVHFLKLLEVASASVCSKIIAAHPQFSDAVPVAVTEVIDELNQDIRNESAQHAKAKKKVSRRKYWNELGEHDVQAAARAQDFERVVTALSVLARCPIETVERAALAENPGAVQVIAKAAGCSWATVRTILLMRAADRRLSKMDLDRAREHFERLETTTAKRVLAFYEGRRNGGANAGVVDRADAVFAFSKA